jgi:nucleoside-diphosphate-sugar epimerase
MRAADSQNVAIRTYSPGAIRQHTMQNVKQVVENRNVELPAGVLKQLSAEESRRLNCSPSGKHRRILVIGGAGYVGCVLVPMLLEADSAVTCADFLLYENGPLVMSWWRNPAFRFHRFDLRDTAAYECVVKGVTDVVLLAGLVGDPITKLYPTQSEAINVEAVKKFVQFLHGRNLNKLVFVSTCSNYGFQKDKTPATETAGLQPLSIYARNKVEIEQFLLDKVSDPPFTILRFATAFGLSPRMRFDLSVSEFVREMFLGRELVVYDPDTWRPYCHVSDLSFAIGRVLDFPLEMVRGQVFNTGADSNNHTKRSLVEQIKQRLPRARVRYQEHGTDPRNYQVDFTKIRQSLHFTPQYSVADGIDELLIALETGVFADVDQRPNFYGNRQIPLLDKELAATH